MSYWREIAIHSVKGIVAVDGANHCGTSFGPQDSRGSLVHFIGGLSQ